MQTKYYLTILYLVNREVREFFERKDGELYTDNEVDNYYLDNLKTITNSCLQHIYIEDPTFDVDDADLDYVAMLLK